MSDEWTPLREWEPEVGEDRPVDQHRQPDAPGRHAGLPERVVSIFDLSCDAVLAAIQDGHCTKAELAAHFEVLPSSLFLNDALAVLDAESSIRLGSDGRYTTNDKEIR